MKRCCGGLRERGSLTRRQEGASASLRFGFPCLGASVRVVCSAWWLVCSWRVSARACPTPLPYLLGPPTLSFPLLLLTLLRTLLHLLHLLPLFLLPLLVAMRSFQLLLLPSRQADVPSIMLTSYPSPVEGWDDPAAERAMEYALSVVVAVRKLRSDYGLNKQKPHLYVAVTDGGGWVRGWVGGCVPACAGLRFSESIAVERGGWRVRARYVRLECVCVGGGGGAGEARGARCSGPIRCFPRTHPSPRTRDLAWAHNPRGESIPLV